MINNNKKTIGIIIFLVTISFLFFMYKPIITYDSSQYLFLKTILKDSGVFSEWENVRGVSFPFSIAFFQIIFGDNNLSLSMFMYVYYILMIGVAFMIYKRVTSKIDLNKKNKILIIILFLIFIIFNPLILGYYHMLLVEFVAMTIALLACFLAWEFLSIDYEVNRRKYILYTFVFTLLGIMMWHMKQPYVSTVLFPLIISCFISIVKNFRLKNIFPRIITILVCIIGLFLSIFIWNYLMEKKNVVIKEEKTSTGLISEQLIKGISEYEIVPNVTKEYITKNNYLSIEEITKLLELIDEGKKDFFVFEKRDGDKLLNTKVVFLENGKISNLDAVKYIIETFIEEPGTVIKSYIRNYLALSDILQIKFKKSINHYEIVGIMPMNLLYENAIFGYWMFDGDGSTLIYINEEYKDYVEKYGDENNPIKFINDIFIFLRIPANIFYKIAFLYLPMLLILNIIRIVLNRKKYSEEVKNIYYLNIILYGYSFLHIFMHGVLGAPIDRYSMPGVITTYIAIIIEICLLIKDVRIKKKMREKKNG